MHKVPPKVSQIRWRVSTIAFLSAHLEEKHSLELTVSGSPLHPLPFVDLDTESEHASTVHQVC